MDNQNNPLVEEENQEQILSKNEQEKLAEAAISEVEGSVEPSQEAIIPVEVSETAPEDSSEVIAAQQESETTTEQQSVAIDMKEMEARSIESEKAEQAKEEEEEVADNTYDFCSKEEVVKAMEDVVSDTNVIKIKKHITLLRSRFLHLLKEEKEQAKQVFYANEENKDEEFKYEPTDLDKRFDKAFGVYKSNKAQYTKNLEKEKAENYKKKQNLLDQLKEVINSEDTLRQIYDRFNEIQVAWKEIGSVPQEFTRDLWNNYHFYVEQLFHKIQMNRELRELDMKKNLERKIELCEKAEALLLEPSINKSFKLLQQYHKEWKEIGWVEESKSEELWTRFKNISDQVNQSRIAHYEELAQEQEQNYQAKLALCEKLDEINNQEFNGSIKIINEATEKVDELFKTWRTLGPAPKEVHEQIWARFRGGLDKFYQWKKEFFSKNKEEQENNYNLKVNLCIQAEAIALRQDWKKATAELLQLQQEWKKIGSVSRKQSELLWTRFRKACDDFFAAKENFFKDIVKNTAENLLKKEELIKKITQYEFVASRDANFEALKEFQREWTLIGPAPLADKDRVWEEFRAIINKRFSELKALVNNEDNNRFSLRISEIKDSQDGENVLNKERKALQTKIVKMKEEVSLWENNLGFFSKSKNTDVLRLQFEEKIEQTKKEIERLKEKLKILNEEINKSKQ